jgi:phospholipid N-methyltransferase
MQCDATYSPEDNKLRLYAATRLDSETYLRVKAAGYSWAPKQELFVAPMWTPEREDLALELAGEIGDEDTTLCDRAEDRAERFADYSDKRAADADRAQRGVAAIADNIPLGQPILVGHHSERHARKDAERIENGMRKTVRMWETSIYWKQRAAGALRAAKYKELPAVRARRIKKIEADKRRQERSRANSETKLKLWASLDTIEKARFVASRVYFTVIREGSQSWDASDVLKPDGERSDRCPAWTLEQVKEHAHKVFTRWIEYCDRWIAHYENRLTYERALLGETGYIAPPKRATKALLPMLNYKQETYEVRSQYRRENSHYPRHDMTKAEYTKINKDYKGSCVSADGTHRIRSAMIRSALYAVFLTDSKVHPKPGAGPIEGKDAELVAARVNRAAEKIERTNANARAVAEHNRAITTAAHALPDMPQCQAISREKLDALRQAAAAGVQVVSAPQLFPTPADLAARMVELAEIEAGQTVLEPSAGTGRLLDAIHAAEPGAKVYAVEINAALCGKLDASRQAVICGDFLAVRSDMFACGSFDRIVMNPPFQNASDVAHIIHARTLLAPGGRLVALCANGSRQAAKLQPLCDSWEELPPGTFQAEGTGVRVVLLTMGGA